MCRQNFIIALGISMIFLDVVDSGHSKRLLIFISTQLKSHLKRVTLYTSFKLSLQITQLSKCIKKIRGKDGSDESVETKKLLLDLVGARGVFLSSSPNKLPFDDFKQVETFAQDGFSSINQILLIALANLNGQKVISTLHFMRSAKVFLQGV